METSRYRIFVGVDLDSRLHLAWAVNAHGGFVAECGFRPDAKGRAWLLNRLFDLPGASPAGIAIGVETPDGALVSFLLEQALDVYAIDPQQLELFHALTNAKQNDRGAFVLAQALRTDLHRFQFLTRPPPVTLTPRHRGSRQAATRRGRKHLAGADTSSAVNPDPHPKTSDGQAGFDQEVPMYRIRTANYPDGKPYTEVHLPPLSDDQLYILDSVVHAIWSVVDPAAGPGWVWLPRASSKSSPSQPETVAPPLPPLPARLDEQGPRAATLGPLDPGHHSPHSKEQNDDQRSEIEFTTTPGAIPGGP